MRACVRCAGVGSANGLLVDVCQCCCLLNETLKMAVIAAILNAGAILEVTV